MENRRTEEVMKAQELYEKLRVLRNDYALERELRAFQVMTNRTLCTVAIAKPVNMEQLGKIKGMIRNYREDMGSLMIPVIREFLGTAEAGRREAVEWVGPVGQEDVPEEERGLYEAVGVRMRAEVGAGERGGSGEERGGVREGAGAVEDVPEEDRDLYELLRQIRRDLARDARWPAYCIMSNKALRTVAAKKPTTIEAFGAIPGISTRRRDESGSLFVSAILEYLTA